MEYRIGDISRILNISSEMVRYYEKKGVITPKRDQNNNYRVYSTMDLFALMEAMFLQRFDINIKQINGVKSKEYTNTLVEHFTNYREEAITKMQYSGMLIQRLDQLIERHLTMSSNYGNFWVKHVDAYDRFALMDSVEDEYFDVQTPQPVFQYLYSDKVLPFKDSIVEFGEQRDHWYEVVDKIFGNHLALPKESRESVSGALCLCTVVDMGGIGEFSHDCTVSLRDYLSAHHYPLVGKIYGLLCGRGIDDGRYHRYMELRAPIKNL